MPLRNTYFYGRKTTTGMVPVQGIFQPFLVITFKRSTGTRYPVPVIQINEAIYFFSIISRTYMCLNYFFKLSLFFKFIVFISRMRGIDIILFFKLFPSTCAASLSCMLL
jgi:hypothetical protein